MDIEEKIKLNLTIRGFDEKTMLNNRGLILATIDETALALVKDLNLAGVSKSLPSKEEINKFLSDSVNELYGEEEHALKRNYINGIKDLYRFIDNKHRGLD